MNVQLFPASFFSVSICERWVGPFNFSTHCDSYFFSKYDLTMIKPMPCTFNENKLSIVKPFFSSNSSSRCSQTPDPEHQNEHSANIHRVGPQKQHPVEDSGIFYRWLHSRAGTVKTMKRSIMWFYSSSSPSLFSYLWRMSCKIDHFEKWLKFANSLDDTFHNFPWFLVSHM